VLVDPSIIINAGGIDIFLLQEKIFCRVGQIIGDADSLHQPYPTGNVGASRHPTRVQVGTTMLAIKHVYHISSNLPINYTNIIK